MNRAVPRAIGVLIVDDNSVVRAVLRDMLGAGGGIEVVGEAAEGAEALRLASALRPDVTLLDHRMPVHDGLSVVAAISQISRVLMLTRSAEDDIVVFAVRAGGSDTSSTASSVRPSCWPQSGPSRPGRLISRRRPRGR